MAELSISNGNRKLVYQVFCGRWEKANVLDYPGEVFRRLAEYDWLSIKKSLGITHVYLLGIWNNEGPLVVTEEQGVELTSKNHRCPSPFAIKNHQWLAPQLGTIEDFSSLVHTLHTSQLQVLVDFVPNHTGLSHLWLQQCPWFYKQTSQNIPKTAFSGDVAELNYEIPDVQQEMLQVLTYIAKSLRVDGVRCDMAHLIPTSFWNLVVPAIRQNYPQFEFIAEAYSHSVFDLSPQLTLIQAGFDAVYDEPLYRNIKQYGKSDIHPIVEHCTYLMRHNSTKWLHYVSNHDDNFPLPIQSFWSFQQLCLLLPGWNLLYNGSLHQLPHRLAHHYIDILSDHSIRIETLPSEMKSWFEWYTDESPMAKEIEVVDNQKIIVHWVGNKQTGTLPLSF